MAGGDFSCGSAEFLTSENPPTGDFRYITGVNWAGETLLHDNNGVLLRPTYKAELIKVLTFTEWVVLS